VEVEEVQPRRKRGWVASGEYFAKIPSQKALGERMVSEHELVGEEVEEVDPQAFQKTRHMFLEGD
jgi:hypothetical protein